MDKKFLIGLDGNQAIAYKNIYYCAEQYIGSLENTMQDSDPDDSWYINAEATLKNHDQLVSIIYSESLNGNYGLGFSGCRPRKEMKFCGKRWLSDCVEKVVTDLGY